MMLCLMPLGIEAAQIDHDEALQRALRFAQQRGVSRQASLTVSSVSPQRRSASTTDGTPGYYLFNIGDGEGFVIVGADDCAAPILGYADSGRLDADRLPDGLRYLLDEYDRQIADALRWGSADAARATADAMAPAALRRVQRPRTAISPLVATRWNQGSPYSHHCPAVGDEHVATGCVATAMAQVMYYHQWPTEATLPIPAYTTRNGLFSLDGLAATTFSWPSMTATYGNAFSGTPAEEAVARLMQYCGWSLQMNYNVSSTGGSSAYNASVAEALRDYFGYDGSITYLQRHHYTYQQWIDIIYGELASRRPVILGGQATGGGHSFVCDGYDTDDYFHINWGWGGQSDGYFRLSALSPYEQGIGGSSSLDGFSFTQDAVVGIRPYAATPAAGCLSLEQMQMDAAGSTATQVVTRSSPSDAFTGISLYAKLCNYSFLCSAYDYTLMLVPAGETTAPASSSAAPASSSASLALDGFPVENISLAFNTDHILQRTDLAIPAALPDGIYHLKLLSRTNGSTSWQECYDGPAQQLTAVVSGNELTLTAPITSGSGNLPVSVTFSAGAMPTKGHELPIVATVTGGTNTYYGNLVLRVDGKAVMGKTVEIPARQAVDVTFAYTPEAEGDDVLSLHTAKTGGSAIGNSQAISVAGSDASDMQELTVVPTFENISEGKLYGNCVRVKARVSNPSTDYSYAGKLNCSLRKYNAATDAVGDYAGATVVSHSIAIEKGGVADVDFLFDGVESGKYYRLRFTYQQGYTDGDKQLTRSAEALITDVYQMQGGYLLYQADATTEAHPSGTIDAGNACFADLTALALTTETDVTPSSNPNCVYLLAEDAAVPSALEGKNVVVGTTAVTLTLTDGHPFFTPIAFTATEASYTRTFTEPAAGNAGWTTLCLPFTATSVACAPALNGSPIEKTWFRSDDDEQGSFWLREFTADAEGTVVFGHAQELRALTPYIIAVPGDTWGDTWQMTGRPVTFSASNADIAPSTTPDGAMQTIAVGGSYYKFCSTTVGQTVGDAYVLNDRGSRFVHATAATGIAPFRAWFQGVSISSLSLSALTIASPTVTEFKGIYDLPIYGFTDLRIYDIPIYNLSGQKVAGASGSSALPEGIYICNGKKIVVKK